ncbi:chromosome partitioning protein ParA [Actinoplanes ianthinogenes]|uniref:Chromosome partitioning protein ParA n=1 Tax=Actinoplanes ianthinogenes TaxID=122358 RepID=A0ABN6C8F4_9ACTN|nr:phage portal protein [Actinoplanes ianthinogenes]BCJ41665.1 chromosome partitioning protein ParA [Actinoplanes ianthinogenes]GGR28560.1 chromosome partitioning protein ParA [Actinoplanes ianthinogenes]
MPDGSIVGLAEELIGELNTATNPRSNFGTVKRYLDGDHDRPYTPRGARQEYKKLADKAITNWLPLISDTYVKGLFVDGYRPARSTTNSAAWKHWQANRMDARQSIIHRSTLEYGVGYALVLPGTPSPLIRPVHAMRAVAFYEDDDDEWARHALRYKGTATDGAKLYELFTATAVHTIAVSRDASKPVLRGTDEHNLGYVPLVRYRERLEGSVGIIRPLIVLQDRINEAVFSLLVALQFASFRQRWATGLAIPLEEEKTLPDGSENPNYGKPVEPFEAAVDRLWVTDSPEAKFGDFAQTEVGGHLETYGSGVRSLAAIAQLSPHVLLGDLVNLSADALAAAEAATQRKIGEYETTFGEAHEQLLRLAAHAANDSAGAQDTAAQVRWRDTEARSLAAAVDALGKMVQMLGVPAEGAWERIPGVTDQDIERWRGMATSSDGLAQLAAAIERQSATPTNATTASTTTASTTTAQAA